LAHPVVCCFSCRRSTHSIDQNHRQEPVTTMRITSALLLGLLTASANGFGVLPSKARFALVRGGSTSSR
jgi:hypothetical protein